MILELSAADRQMLRQLEESLWREETRFDPAFMDRLLAADFLEFGRSGRVYDRAETLASSRRLISAVIPLPEFQARLIAPEVALVTYCSHVDADGRRERGRRSSLWSRTTGGWVLRFHQGTPC